MRYTILLLLPLLASCAMGDGSVVNVANTTVTADNGSTVDRTISAPNLDPTTNLVFRPF